MPAVAAGAIYKNQRAKAAYKRAQERIAQQKTLEGAVSAAVIPGASGLPAPDGSGSAPVDANAPIATQAGFDRIIAYVDGKVKQRTAKGARLTEGPVMASVVLSPEATAAKPAWTVCETLPPAVLVDVDAGTAPLAPTNELLADTLDALRGAGAKVIYVASAGGDALATDLMVVGLGPAVRGETLFLVGDKGSSTKDNLRWKIASSHCIIAQLGEGQSDFSDLFSAYARHTLTPPAAPITALQGAGWFAVRALGTGQ